MHFIECRQVLCCNLLHLPTCRQLAGKSEFRQAWGDCSNLCLKHVILAQQNFDIRGLLFLIFLPIQCDNPFANFAFICLGAYSLHITATVMWNFFLLLNLFIQSHELNQSQNPFCFMCFYNP